MTNSHLTSVLHQFSLLRIPFRSAPGLDTELVLPLEATRATYSRHEDGLKDRGEILVQAIA